MRAHLATLLRVWNVGSSPAQASSHPVASGLRKDASTGVIGSFFVLDFAIGRSRDGAVHGSASGP